MKKYTNYIVAIALIATLFLLVTFTQIKEIEITEDDKQTYSLAPSIATSHTQTNTYTVKSINSVYVGAGTYWYQLGDKRWRADTEFGAITVANKNNYPTPTVVKERHDLSNWQLYGDQAFRSDNGRVFNGTQLNEKFIASANDAKFRNASSFSGKGIQVENGTKVVLNFESGYGYTPTKYNLIAGSTTRYEAMYLTPFDVYWSGKVIETYEISTDPDTTINSGTTKQLFAFTRSKTGKEGWTGYKNVTSVPETKWTTDNPSVATVSSTGVVTGLKGGVATITATWKSGDYHIKASTKVTVKQMVVGTFLLNGKTNVCLNEGSLTIQALYYEGTSTGTNVLAETSLLTSNHNIASINAKIIQLHSVGKVTITGKYKDKTHTLTITIIDCNTKPKPTDPTEPPPSEPTEPTPIEPEKPKVPPQVSIDEIPEVTVGEYFCFVAYATDEDGYITNYNWDKGSFITTDTTSSAICGYYEKVGKPSIKVTVTDNDGLTASATTTTNVKTATPSAYVYVSGDLRENRIVKVGVSDPYNDNEVLHKLAPITKQTLEVSVVNEGDEIKYQKAIPATFSSNDIFEFIAKFTGEVKLKRTVENSLGQKDSFETTIYIAPDLAPIVDFRVSEVNYRSYDEGSGEPATATINIDDSSYSIDGDKISKRILTVTFDANNNGIFTDDIPNVIELGEEQKNVEFTTQQVGKYLIEMEVWEDIFTNTFFEYVDLTYNKESTDLRFADTSNKPVSEKITEVDNIAPYTSLNASVRKKASVQVDVTNSPFTKEELQKQQAALSNELVQKNIVADITFFDNTVNMDNVKYYVTANNKIHFLQTADNEMYVKYQTVQKHTFPAKIKKVSMGYEHAFVLLENNTYYGIGVEREGQMGGHGATLNSIGEPTLKEFSAFWKSKGLTVIDVSAGRDHSLFLTSTGVVYAIGANDFKQTGISSFDPYGEPPKVNLTKKIKAVQGGFYASFLLTESNTMMGVGYNDSGILGLGNTTSQTTFKESTTVNTIKEMFYTDSLTLILASTNGSFYGLGLNNNDNLNIGSTTYVTRPTLIKDVPVGTKKIISNSSAAALVTNSGEVYVRGQARNVGVNATGSGWTKVTSIEGKAKDVDFRGYSSGSVIISTDKGFYHVVSSKMEKIDVYGIFGLEEPKAHDITKVAKGYQYNYIVGLNQQGTEAYYKDVMKNLVDGHFVGVSKTQDTIINNMIKWNGNRGSYIKLGNDTKEVEINTMYKKLAEYMKFSMNDTNVHLHFDTSDPLYTENDLTESVTNLKEILASNNIGLTVSYGVAIPDRNESIYSVKFSNGNSITESSLNVLNGKSKYLIGISTSANEESDLNNYLKRNRTQGKFISISEPMEQETKDEFMAKIAEYILLTLSNRNLTVDILSNDALSNSELEEIKNVIREKAESMTFNVHAINNKVINSSFNYQDILSETKGHLTVAYNLNGYSKSIKTHLKAGVLINNGFFIGIGNEQNETHINDIINSVLKKGKFVQNTTDYMSDFEVALGSLLKEATSKQEQFVLLNDYVEYSLNYIDMENDSILEEKLSYTHDEKIFENDLGKTTSGQTAELVKRFSHTGLFLPIYQVKDNPLEFNFEGEQLQQFANYQKWSNESSDLKIFVHRLPNPNFETTLDKVTGEYTITNNANDLDKASINIGFGNGIASQNFYYRIEGDSDWIFGLPPNPIPSNIVYEIRSTVVDFQSQTNHLVKTLSRLNLPPVAEFETDKSVYSSGDSVIITNYSYDPNNDDLTAVWSIKEESQADTEYVTFAKNGTLKKGVASGNWHTVIDNITCEKINETCKYVIKLYVEDDKGESAETTKTIEVTLSEILDLGIRDVEIFTAPAANGLPVYMSINETILIQNPDSILDARQLPIEISVYRDGQYIQNEIVSVETLLQGHKFILSNKGMISDEEYHFEFVLNTLNKEITIAAGYDRIDLKARTAEEKEVILKRETSEYKAFLVAKRSVGEPQINLYEKFVISTKNLNPTVTGLGLDLNQSIAHNLPFNREYSLMDLPAVQSEIIYDSNLIDSYLDIAKIEKNRAIVQTIQTVNTTTSSQQEDISIITLSHPKVYVEANTGHLFSEQQVLNNDNRIRKEVYDGGNKLYTPIWLDRIGHYNIHYKTTSLGVNNISFVYNQDLEIEGYMFLHINSNTKDKDKWLMEPVLKKNPFPNGLLEGWTKEEEEWLKN